MRRSLFMFGIALVIGLTSFLVNPPIYADPPPNTTSLSLILPQDLTTSSTLPGELYIPWSAIVTLLDEKVAGTGDPADIDFAKYGDQYAIYLEKNLQLTNNDALCPLKVTTVPTQNQNDIYFGLGVQLNVMFTCTQSLDTLLLRNTIFSDMPVQENTVQIFKGSKENLLQLIVLTPQSAELPIGNKASQITVTPTSVSQTNSLMSQLTAQLTTVPFWLLLIFVFALGFLHTAEAGHSKTILSAALIDKKIDFRQSVAFSAVFTVTHVVDIALMGIILLVANSFVDVFSKLPYLQLFSLYALLFVSLYMLLQSLAHFVRTKFKQKNTLGKSLPEDTQSPQVKGLVSSSLLQTSHTHAHGGIEHSHEDLSEFLESNKKIGLRQQLLMGIITGIAPCLFGWSIFMVVLSTHKVWTIFPVIAVFALGIFAALMLFAIVITKLKSTVFKRVSWLREISPIISAGFLLAYSIMVLM